MQNWVAVWWYTPTTVRESAFTVSLPSARKVLLQTTSTVCRWKVAPVARSSRGGLPPAVWFETLLAMEVVNQTRANDTLPPDMIFGQAQIISISAYTPLFIISAVLNLRVLRKLWQTKHRNGLSRLNQLLMHLVLADLSVSQPFAFSSNFTPIYPFPLTVMSKVIVFEFAWMCEYTVWVEYEYSYITWLSFPSLIKK